MSERGRAGGVEEEKLYNGNGDGVITEPFNPKDVDIISQPMVISNLIDRLECDDIILDPDFQRRSDLWDAGKQSRLIESLIIRIPLPTFYFDCTEDDKLIVVDGLQRLNAIRNFIVRRPDDPKRLILEQLEYLREYEGYVFEELPPSIRRRIREQLITAYVIRPGTPDKVRTSIFTRINTGGLTLEPAEIRNSVYRGQAADLLKELAHSAEFVQATRGKIDPSRMMDCEFVNRFLAFYLLGTELYEGNLELFLNNVLIRLQNEPIEIIDRCRFDFLRAMRYAGEIFGEKAFRKLNADGRYGQINKPLYDAVSANLARLPASACEILVERKEQLWEKYLGLLKDERFVDMITQGTATMGNVRSRHENIGRIFQEVLAG